jgi:hypothetical protein
VVRFEEHDCAGAVTCRLPMALADRLFDAFTGRDPDEAPAPVSEIHDLVGEFANMICGSWLTRAANARTFTLGRPTVHDVWVPAALTPTSIPLAIDEQPCLIDIAFTAMPETVAVR